MTGNEVSLQYRRADLSDLDDLVKMRVAFLYDLLVNLPEPEDEIQRFAEANREYFRNKMPSGEYVCWVAEKNGQMVATCGMVLFDRPPKPDNLSGRDAYIINVYTMPEWRGKGVASQLMHKLIAHANDSGVGHIALHTTESGRGIYEKLGFVATTTEMELVRT